MKTENKKPAFTLVELAAALVVIGVLLGLAVKGAAILEAAKIKSDINKLNKLGAGIASYYSLKNMPPGKTPKEIYDNLIKENVADDKDFKLASASGKYWRLIPCTDENGVGEGWITMAGDNNKNICAYVTDAEPDNETAAPSQNVPVKFFCYIETRHDDKDWLRGDGRMWGALAPGGKLQISDWDCSLTGDALMTDIYYFRIF